jgi:hypothetical protein
MTTNTTLTNAAIIEEYGSIDTSITYPGYIGDFPFLQVATLLAVASVLGILMYAVLFV